MVGANQNALHTQCFYIINLSRVVLCYMLCILTSQFLEIAIKAVKICMPSTYRLYEPILTEFSHSECRYKITVAELASLSPFGPREPGDEASYLASCQSYGRPRPFVR